MALEKYREKRSEEKTPEPFGGKPSGKELRFVVQKHDASHLHYDFRLEMDGVLKSWAVPKGPSLDPNIKRLAMMVEDHPYDYRDFEGIIPKGQYGGGTVIVWDEGTYEPSEPVEGDLKKQEENLLHQLHAGKLKIKLNGKKLKGEFALVKAYGRGENSWLLMKLEDKYATTRDITLKDKSVISKKTIVQMEKSPDKVYGKPNVKKESRLKDKTTEKKTTPELIEEQLSSNRSEKEDIDVDKILKGAPKKAFYNHVQPMLATLVDKPFEDKNWLYEVKWDGYRAVSFLKGGKVEIKSRNDKSFNEKFYPVYDSLKALNLNVILDGEIVVVGEDGKADFGSLQNWRSEADGTLLYYVFDIIWHDGKDLTDLTLCQRKEILKEILEENDIIKISTPFYTSGIEFLEAAKNMGLEGIMAKKKDSLYHVHVRTKDWLKIKANKRQEVVIGGFTLNDDSRKSFSSILVGVYEGKDLVYKGKVGTGFNDKLQKEMMEQFKPLFTNKPPFSEEPDVNKPSRFRPNPPHASVTWLKPKLICEISFTEMTSDGVMRHPSFEGMREDKDPMEIILEKEIDTAQITDEHHEKIIKPAGKMKRKTLLNPTEKTQVKTVNKHELKFTNLDKVFWPKAKITKRDLINYYYQVAPFILPYLKDRPQSMNRFPNGIEGKSFYFKNVTDTAPDWADTFLYRSETDNEDKHYLVGKDEATLLYMANLGCIEMNPWNSTIKKPEHPTYCIVDLDPDKNSFDQVIETAQVTKQILDDMGIDSYCKTSGSTGLHIYIPLGNKYTYEQSKEFARVIVTLVHQELPDYTSLERVIKDRKGKMYLDFLQNRPHATIASVYSVRPKPGATVSMPLHWDEVKKGLKMSDFHIFNTLERLQSEGDIFKPVLGKGIDLKKIIDKYAGK
ncbi:DNA ligase D [Chryseobacterium sp. PTM-20240506]|uniref:DNA ligase D n=1 Tax=unclassified Chryseobacterium TaxID=2593645 RepID=UPI002358B0EE|nr:MULTISPECIES: DNA ligase D [unclassified Chryseobacterium]MDC8103500.1 DNA ligase D [Chryseobacterium sp. B21-037]MDC8107114.1 DNA ligase D [Chryseobacterium sp. B21-037]MDQ1803106.1 DNA ligase D [Chryseobacterium sp. CKR4-1]